MRALRTYERHLEVAKLVPEVLGSVDTDKSGDEEAYPLDAVGGESEVSRAGSYRDSRDESTRRVEAYLATHPIEIPVKAKKTHHSSSNGLCRVKRSAQPSANRNREYSPALLVVEASEEVDGGEGEEEEHRVEEYEATNDEPSEVCEAERRSGRRSRLSAFTADIDSPQRVIRVTICCDHLENLSSTAVPHASGTMAIPGRARRTLIAR